MVNTNTNTTPNNQPMTAEQLFATAPTLAEVLNTGTMDIPPRCERVNDEPFVNLAEKALKNACLHDRAFQDSIAREHNKAHEIIKMYYGGSLGFEETVTLLMTECHRDRACAILNIQNSTQRLLFV